MHGPTSQLLLLLLFLIMWRWFILSRLYTQINIHHYQFGKHAVIFMLSNTVDIELNVNFDIKLNILGKRQCNTVVKQNSITFWFLQWVNKLKENYKEWSLDDCIDQRMPIFK